MFCLLSQSIQLIGAGTIGVHNYITQINLALFQMTISFKLPLSFSFFEFMNLRTLRGNNFRLSNINLIQFVGDTKPKTLKFAFLKLMVKGTRNDLSSNVKHGLSHMCVSHDLLSYLQIIKILQTNFFAMSTFCLF